MAKAATVLGEPDRGTFDAAVLAAGGTSTWRLSQRAGRSYALLRFDGIAEVPADVRAAAAAIGAVAYDAPVIAVAVFPSVAEALPVLVGALDGPGRPAGMRACEPCGGGGVAIEWDLDATSAAVVMGVVDVELARFTSGRSGELLAPLPPHWVTRIAAGGLRAPEISPERMLETLLERAGLHV